MDKRPARAPKYIQIANALAGRIQSGALVIGDKLPTVDELGREFNANHCTISAAIKHLATHGMVVSRKRAGVIVLPAKPRPGPGERFIALMLSSVNNPFSTQIIHCLENRCRTIGFRLHLVCSNDDPFTERDLLMSVAGKAAGIIAVPCGSDINAENFNAVIGAGTPVVFLDQFVRGVGAPLSATDHATGAYLATTHLLRCGCSTTYMFVGGAGTSREERIFGFRKALAEEKRRATDGLFLQAASHSPEDGYMLARRLMTTTALTFPVGLFVTNDYMARGVYAAAKECGLIIGHEVRIVGFDDIDAVFMDPPLSTVSQDMAIVSNNALDILTKLIDSAPGAEQESVRIVPELVVRNSCQPTPSKTVYELLAQSKDPAASARLRANEIAGRRAG